jgi:hypothetical protein
MGPQINDNAFFFHNNNTLAPPPTTIDIISDINTSKDYVKSYREVVLLPILFYIDGAATGQFADLPITPLRILLGIFNRKAREKGHSWRTLGYVPAYSVEEATGNCTLHQSGHMESGLRHEATDDSNSTNIPVCTHNKAQDLHSILAKILESFIEIQNTRCLGFNVSREKIFFHQVCSLHSFYQSRYRRGRSVSWKIYIAYPRGKTVVSVLFLPHSKIKLSPGGI